MRDEAWEPFEQLGASIQEALESIGVRFVMWAPFPGTKPSDRKMCQIVAELDDEAFKSQEQKDTDAAFAQIARDAAADARREEGRDILNTFLSDPPKDDGAPPE